MSELLERKKTSPHHAVVSRAGVKYFIRTVQVNNRQSTIGLPPEVRKEAGLWRGRLVYIWVVKGVVMMKPLQQDIAVPDLES